MVHHYKHDYLAVPGIKMTVVRYSPLDTRMLLEVEAMFWLHKKQNFRNKNIIEIKNKFEGNNVYLHARPRC